jgi:putative transcriptional regulator
VTQPEVEADLRFRIFANYSGWGPDQLESELTEGVWSVVAANGKLLFDTPVDELWTRLLPPTLPRPSMN